MTPMALTGKAVRLGNLRSESGRRALVRLRRPSATTHLPHAPQDIALVSNEADLAAAKSLGFDRFCSIGTPKTAIYNDSDGFLILPASAGFVDDGDIVGVEPQSGSFRVLYRRRSSHNGFLVTDRCNHYCLMCSQPPKNVDDSWLLEELAELIPLIDPATRSIGFTGGEPFLNWRGFIDVIRLCRDALPNTAVQVLTNGRAFVQTEVVDAWSGLSHELAYVAIPIYAAVDYVHDHVVQAKGAFDETLLGILKLKDRGRRVEIRIVLHKITAPRLQETCAWIARNLPFVDHVALMGMENVGFALANEELLWIDPVDYMGELGKAIRILDLANLNSSIYNLPLCVLPDGLRSRAVRSISDWKNDFPPICDDCGLKNECPGFFSTGRPKISRGIRPQPMPIGSC